LTIRKSFDLCSADLQSWAIDNMLWDGKGEFDFARTYSAGGELDEEDETSRFVCGAALMKKCKDGELDQDAMVSILRSHEGGICMHGGFETTASMVSELRKDGDGNAKVRHWMTGQSHPCKSPFHLQDPL